MEAIKLRDGFCWTGIIDDKLRVFDIEMCIRDRGKGDGLRDPD